MDQKLKITTPDQIQYRSLTMPDPIRLTNLPEIPGSVYQKRLETLLPLMNAKGLDALLIYADREHFQNFEYLYGFEPRFEEGIAVIHQDGTCYAILGNECLPLTDIAKIKVTPVLCQLMSMPGQPMSDACDLADSFRACGLTSGNHVGVIGWKLFPEHLATGQYYDLPYYIITQLQAVLGVTGTLLECSSLFIAPGTGIRNFTEPEQIAAFEYASTMISAGMLEAMEAIAPGKSELEIGSCLNPCGLPLSCHTNVSAGLRTKTGLVSPSSNVLKVGDPMTFCWGIRGALSCRAGYVANSTADLPENAKDYMEVIVKPYFAAAVSWYENIGLGIKGKDMYEMIQKIFPKETYGWVLNPGHCLSSEEWINSPIYRGSEHEFKSGQFVQLDIIPSPKAPYYTSNIEDGILLADEALRLKLKEAYPDMWARIQKRRDFMENTLGISLKEEVLPLYETQGILNPYLLNKGFCLQVEHAHR